MFFSQNLLGIRRKSSPPPLILLLILLVPPPLGTAYRVCPPTSCPTLSAAYTHPLAWLISRSDIFFGVCLVEEKIHLKWVFFYLFFLFSPLTLSPTRPTRPLPAQPSTWLSQLTQQYEKPAPSSTPYILILPSSKILLIAQILSCGPHVSI